MYKPMCDRTSNWGIRIEFDLLIDEITILGGSPSDRQDVRPTGEGTVCR